MRVRAFQSVHKCRPDLLREPAQTELCEHGAKVLLRTEVEFVRALAMHKTGDELQFARRQLRELARSPFPSNDGFAVHWSDDETNGLAFTPFVLRHHVAALLGTPECLVQLALQHSAQLAQSATAQIDAIGTLDEYRSFGLDDPAQPVGNLFDRGMSRIWSGLAVERCVGSDADWSGGLTLQRFLILDGGGT